MGGGLLQLVAYGAQDVYLTGNPQITFFKVVYRRHTNFSIESIQQTFNGNATLGQRVTCQISRNGDLVHKLYLQATVAKTASTAYNNIGHWLVKQVEVEIGGQMIDRQYGEWMYIWNELTLPKGKEAGFGEMIKTFPASDATLSANVYVPLEFWFCRNIGLALPLIALQYHEVKINLTLNDADASNGITGVSNVELWADYIFLDTDERRRFAQLSHEYLIEQVQFTGGESIDASSSATATVTTKSKLSFNHPVKELVWVNKPTDAITSALWNGYQSTTDFQLQLNGNDRFAKRDAKYFTHVQPYQHHENIPDGKHIHVYSFALKPEEHQPSGTLNMSRIDTATAIVGTAGDGSSVSAAGTLNMYAVNYNVLRILSGMGGLAYSN
jgi:hypothetical protein